MWTFFANFDLDCNLLEEHFVEAYSRKTETEGNLTYRPVCHLCDATVFPTPMHVDSEGNTYVFTRLYYTGNAEDPHTIVIDGDTNKTYNYPLPGSEFNDFGLYNVVFYKFTNDWELDFAKVLVNHTEGIAASSLVGDSVNPHYTPFPIGISYDEEDNLVLQDN